MFANPHRHCNKCGLHDVQDESHVLFLCPCIEMCYLRRKIAEQFTGFTTGDSIFIGDTGFF